MKKCFPIAFIACTVFLFFGCSKSYLDVEPKAKVIARQLSDYNGLLNSAYLINTGLSSSSNTITGFPNAQVALSDEVIAIDPYFAAAPVRTQRLFRWDDVVYEADQDAQEIGGLLTQLYTYNKIINEVMNAVDGTTDQKTALYAEALANRAWCYLMLANYYGKPYNAATATADLSFPIVREADVSATSFQRATVQQVYDFMVSDLTTGIPNMPLTLSTRARMCKSAAEVLLGKVYVFMGNYTAALTQLKNAVTDLPTDFSVSLYDYNTTLATGGTWGYNATNTPISYITGMPTAWNNTENIFCKQVNGGAWTSTLSDILLSPTAAALFQSTDMRLRLFSPQPSGGGSFAVAGALRGIRATQVQIGIRLPELYLLKAECEARTGDLTGAIADLQILRAKRMPAASASVSITDQTALVKYVIDERSREFALQGFRWFDIRRLSTDPLFSSNVYTHKYYSSTGSLLNTYTLSANRLTMRFPQKLMDQNPGMQNNP